MAKRRKHLGSVDLLGLNAFGMGGVSPLYGTLIGGGTAGIAGILAKKFATPGGFVERNDQLIGFGAGVAVSAAMFSMKSTRSAAIYSLVGAFLTSGFHVLADMITGSRDKHLGIAQINALNGLGIPMLDNLPAPAGNVAGLGIPQITDLPQPAGLRGLGLPQMSNVTAPIGVAGPQLGRPQLVGMGTGGLASHFGATLVGGGR
jgi:hypothetical protein